MFISLINRSHRTLARIELTDEQIKAQAPSVFAVQPLAGVSERYTFLPTSRIIDRMRQEGCETLGSDLVMWTNCGLTR